MDSLKSFKLEYEWGDNKPLNKLRVVLMANQLRRNRKKETK